MQRLFIFIQYILPHHLLSRLVGYLANCQWRFVKIPFMRFFVRRYQIDLEEARHSELDQYANFNALFTRELKQGARPIVGDENKLVCPADGTISQLGAIKNDQLLQAKGRHFSVTALLGGDSNIAEGFRDGSFVTVYLSPKDYHRVHMPITGKLTKTIYLPGRLFSVNQVTADSVPGLFARNERLVCLFETSVGPMALVLVGAMIVAGIETIWSGRACPNHHGMLISNYDNKAPPIQIVRGGEMGRFMMGSTVIVLFGPGGVQLEAELQSGQTIKLGQVIANQLAAPEHD